MLTAIVKAIAGASARVLVRILWTLGDKLFDWFVTKERAREWRSSTLERWTISNRKVDEKKPTSWIGKMWKDNAKEALDASGEYMGFSPYQTIAQRAEKMINAGGVHQP